MSRLYSSGQYEGAYAPHRLGNWEVPDTAKVGGGQKGHTCGHMRTSGLPPLPRLPHLQAAAAARPGAGPRTNPTPIADARGHLLPGVAKRPGAFVRQLPPYAAAPPRWPAPLPTLTASRAATMGYKGVPTHYLRKDTNPSLG